MIQVKLLILLLFIVQCYCNNFDQFRDALQHIKASESPVIQQRAVEDLILRIVPDKANLFFVKITPSNDPDNQFFKIYTTNGKIYLEGTTGVELATAFNHYLKYYCGSHTSWNDYQLSKDKIVAVKDVNITITMNDRFRYYQNVCTTSYSFVWWDWKHWEKHIDWIVMNSYNLVLTFTGQEAIWYQVYKKLNLTETDIDEHFTGPAFLSWLRMGNIRGWGGPLSIAWHGQTLYLQTRIVGRLRSFGVITVMPAFAGHVPVAFKRLYPNVNMTRMERWNQFNDSYCCPYFISPTEDLFKTVGTMFLQELIAQFGTDHVYNCDSFNEVDPASADLKYLSDVSKSIYSGMYDADKDSVWLMQGWLFVSSDFWKDTDRAKALLTGVPKGKMIVLDLQSEQYPQYERLSQYFGQPYIWCMLHNFGGVLGMFGSFDILNTQPRVARNLTNSTMIGTGLTPEGINQNYVVYEFMSEAAWRKEEVDTKKWMETYTERRYGIDSPNLKEAWTILLSSIYNYKGQNPNAGQYAMVKVPSWDINTWSWYEFSDLSEASNLYVSVRNETVLQNSSTYLYDFVDLERQFLQQVLEQIYESAKKSFKERNLKDLVYYSDAYLKNLNQLNDALAKHEGFMLGTWLEMAKNYANDSKDEELFEFNARIQISLWAPVPEDILDNYATKQWHGVVSDLYSARWKMFFDYSKDILTKNGTFDQNYIRNEIFTKVEEPFTKSRKIYPSKAKGNLLSELDKHANYIQAFSNLDTILKN